MRIANLSGRAVVIDGERAVDVERASQGRFSSDPQSLFESWDEILRWSATVDRSLGEAYASASLQPCVPRPRQIFAIGLNYALHVKEAGFTPPAHPMVFGKFASSLAGAESEVALSGDRVDWEAELVAVIGRGGRNIAEADAWDHVAGLTVGQDISDREVQLRGNRPQFSLAKSMQNYSPIGPWVVSVDEIGIDHDRDDLSIRCTLAESDGTEREVQSGRTKNMLFSIPALVSQLSASVELLPGDLVFTGTPEGIGDARTPPEYLRPGQVLTTTIEGIGSIRQTIV